VPLHDGPEVARTEAALGDVAGRDRIAVHFEGHVPPRVHGNEPLLVSSGVKPAKAILQKLDRLDEAFLYSESIDLTSYSRQRDKLREELTLAKIEHHTDAIDELDVQGILAFAERILPRASAYGCRRRSTTSSGSSNGSSPKELRTIEIGSIEPLQRRPFSTTWRRIKVLGQVW